MDDNRHYPKWMQQKESTRAMSNKQEKKIAKRTGGKLRVNSGATFKQNDVFCRELDIEAKITAKTSFSVTEKMFDKLTERCDTTKIGVLVAEFAKSGKTLAILDFDELLYLIEKLREK